MEYYTHTPVPKNVQDELEKKYRDERAAAE
jgi:hypothetical protein